MRRGLVTDRKMISLNGEIRVFQEQGLKSKVHPVGKTLYAASLRQPGRVSPCRISDQTLSWLRLFATAFMACCRCLVRYLVVGMWLETRNKCPARKGRALLSERPSGMRGRHLHTSQDGSTISHIKLNCFLEIDLYIDAIAPNPLSEVDNLTPPCYNQCRQKPRLSALAIFRLIAEMADKQAKLQWQVIEHSDSWQCNIVCRGIFVSMRYVACQSRPISWVLLSDIRNIYPRTTGAG